MKFVLIILSFFIIVNVSAVNVSGKVTNDKGEPLAYAGIYIKGTTLGTTTNIDGNFQFNLKEGNYELVFQYIGYKKHIEKITITNKPISLKIKLQSENISLKEVVITASQEDPAYPVIRNAIAKRKYYLEQVEKYQCRVFTKGIMRLTDAPNKILGKKLDEERDSIKGIIYLSESESDISFKQPDKMKEVMVSSKVSGDSKGFSVNFYTFFTTSFYENLVNPAIGNRRGFVSPISTSALFYYKYHLEGTFVEGNDIIYKIKLIPKRKADPVFSGDIYIVDNSWRIYSVNLIIGKEAHINFIDTVRICQQYFAATDSVWMIFNQKMEFKFRFNFFGKVFAGNGVFHSQNTNYKFDMVYPDDYFTKEIIKVEKDANKKDSAYWEKSRPIPLTDEEKGNYKKEDSIYIIHNSKAYLDSMDKKSNKFSLSDLWSSYRYRNRYDSIEFTVKSPLMATSFNTVQGLNTDLTLGYSKEYESGNKLNINHKLTYGFSDKQLRYRFNTTYLYSREDRGNISFTATYKDAMQINNSNPISDLSNTIYTLFIKSNYLKLYEKSAININNNFEITNGILSRVNIEYAERSPLVNHTNYTWVDVKNREFTSNDPQNPLNNNPAFPTDQAFTIDMSLRIRFQQRYLRIPQKVIVGSKYPDFLIHYRKGIPDIFGSDVDYDLLEFSVRDHFRLGLLGNSNYRITFGDFVRNNKMSFVDYKHYSGNTTIFKNTSFNSFQLLDYYTNSTNKTYLEFHFEHHFDGWIINKIPLVRKTALREIAGFHLLSNEYNKYYMEVNFGLDNIFKVFRVDFITSFDKDRKLMNGFVIHIPFLFSGNNPSVNVSL